MQQEIILENMLQGILQTTNADLNILHTEQQVVYYFGKLTLKQRGGVTLDLYDY